MRQAPIPPKFWTFMSKVLAFIKKSSFRTVLQIKKRWKIDKHNFLGGVFIFLIGKNTFLHKREQKLTKKAILTLFLPRIPNQRCHNLQVWVQLVNLSFQTVFQIKKRWKIDKHIIVGMYFIFLRGKNKFLRKKRTKIDKKN